MSLVKVYDWAKLVVHHLVLSNLKLTEAPANILTLTSWETPNQNYPVSYSYISDSQKYWYNKYLSLYALNLCEFVTQQELTNNFFFIYYIAWCVVVTYLIFTGRGKQRKDEDIVGRIQNRKGVLRNHDIKWL